jgi:glycosyltransferase involved in cell wall biosynthesis
MRAAASCLASRTSARCAHSARHMVRLLPRPLRVRLRRTAEWFSSCRAAPLIEDWSRPLIEARSSSESFTGLIRASASTAGPDLVQPMRTFSAVIATARNVPTIRCLLVTVALDVGGLDEVVAFLARRLPSQRLDTAVLHIRSDPAADGQPTGRLGRMLQSECIQVHEVHNANKNAAQHWLQWWRPDVISAHGALPKWFFPICKRLGVPCVDTLHGMPNMFVRSANSWSETAYDARRSALVAVSELVRQRYLADNADFPPDRILTIPHGVDDERRSWVGRQASRNRLGLTDEYLFVSLARHSPEKNSYGLLAAFGRLAQICPDAHLVIAGRPDNIRYYRQVVRLRESLPHRNNIHLRDHMNVPTELLAAADGFVLNSFCEGGPLVGMEALCAGVPVVLSDVGGAREQVGDDPARGFVVANPLGDPLAVDWESVGTARYSAQVNCDELVTAMAQLASGRMDYLANRERLAVESAARFSADACLAQHAALLRAVADGADLPSGDMKVTTV